MAPAMTAAAAAQERSPAWPYRRLALRLTFPVAVAQHLAAGLPQAAAPAATAWRRA